MAAWELWLKDNWFIYLQSLGIAGSLIFTALSLRRDTKARTISDFLAVTELHRELWSEVHRRPDLARVLLKEADLIRQPASPAEQEFLNTVFVHFYTGWLLSRHSVMATEAALAVDVKDFFSRPLPRQVWNETKSARDPRFCAYVEGCLAR